MSLKPGTKLGPYTIGASLGAGGMGEVYRAEDSRLDRTVAIKVLPRHLSASTEMLTRFEREAKAVAALSHPNIMAIHDFGVVDGTAFAVVELLEGETLRHKLDAGPLPVRKAVEYALQIVRGLGAAHERGIVHRDLKPDNVMITRDGIVKILDFGLARQQSGFAASSSAAPGTASGGTESPAEPLPAPNESPTQLLQTEPGRVMGTVGYMSPEQVRGAPADFRSDIFSLGVILYEMLTGQRAFKGDSAVETMNAILKEDPPELSISGKQIPPALDRLVRHCLEKAPADRFQSCRDLAFDLESMTDQTVTGRLAPIAGATRRGLPLPVKVVAGLVLLVAAAALGFLGARGRGAGTAPSVVTFDRITFRRGNLLTARFAPDGQTIVYGAAWDYQPTDLYMTRATASESRSLGLRGADLLAISDKGEMAILFKNTDRLSPSGEGTLARVSMSGGAPRELLENVTSADWSPNGEDLAVVRRFEGLYRVEYPIGHALYSSVNPLFSLRTSPRGDRVAFMASPSARDRELLTVDTKGNQKVLVQYRGTPGGLVWTRDGSKVLFAGPDALESVTLGGEREVVMRSAEQPLIHDISRDGRLLIESFNFRAVMMWASADDQREKDLSWFDQSRVTSLSPDHQSILFTDRGGAYLRKIDGSPAVRLGDGAATSFTPDGKWVLMFIPGPPASFKLVPTGPGEIRPIETGSLTVSGGSLAPDGKRLLFRGTEPGHGLRVYVQDLAGGTPKPVTPEGITCPCPMSPDGKFTFGRIGDEPFIFPIDGGAQRPVHGLSVKDTAVRWNADGSALYVANFEKLPMTIELFDIVTGRRTPWKVLRTTDLYGIIGVTQVVISADGSSYAYTCGQTVHSDLYIVEGLN